MSIGRIIVSIIALAFIVFLISVVVRAIFGALNRGKGTTAQQTIVGPGVSNSPTPTPTPTVVPAILTSQQAAETAYNRAKNWSPNAVLWSESPLASQLSTNWLRTDQSNAWNISFGNPDTKEIFTVQISGNGVALASVSTNTMMHDYNGDWPKDAPKISMAAAAGVLPTDLLLGNQTPIIYYRIDNPNLAYNGRPVWEFQYSLNGITYYVDGLTGQYLGQSGNAQTL